MLTTTYEEWLATTFRPVMGREDDDPEDPAAGGDPNADPADPDPENPSGGDPNPDDPANSEDPETDPETDPEEEELDRIKTDRDKARSELAAAQAAVRKAKAEARQAREDAAKKHGNWEQVAKERESEIADLNERLQKAETDRVEATERLDSFQREVRITRIASKLGFRDSQDAIVQLKDQPEATGDDKSCERALRKLAEEKSYLVDVKRARGRSMNGAGGGPGLTHEQLENMSPDEINRNWEAVQAALSRGRG